MIAIFGLCTIGLYDFIFISIFNLNQNLITDSKTILAILIGFMIVASFFRPFIGLLNQTNNPGIFSIVILTSVIINIILNSFLIPLLGINGAAISTGIVFLLESYFLLLMGKRHINMLAEVK